MIVYRTKTIWKERNQVGVPDMIIKVAREEGIEIKFFDKTMTIKATEIEEKTVGRSDRPFADRKKGGGFYHLVYFVWKPDDSDQIKLL